MSAFALDEFTLLELTGDDRLEWLQGQATNDVRGLEPGTRISFCFCEPTGQILAVLDAWAFEDRIVLATARERSAAVLERVERMTILEDVAARELPLQGVWASSPLAQEGLLILPWEGGWAIWGESAAIDALKGRLPMGDSEPWRIAAGLPKWGADMGPRTLAPELGPNFEARHVSYAKGCYTGQEVLMRMHSRGHTNRTWVGLVAQAEIVIGEAVTHAGKEVGRVTSAARSADARWVWIGAATLRNEATADETRVQVGEADAEVRAMPILPPAA